MNRTFTRFTSTFIRAALCFSFLLIMAAQPSYCAPFFLNAFTTSSSGSNIIYVHLDKTPPSVLKGIFNNFKSVFTMNMGKKALENHPFVHIASPNTIICPTISDSIIILRNVTCVAGNNGELHVVGKGGVAPYTYTLNTISGNVTNNTGIFTGLVAKDYRLIITDDNGCRDTFIRTIESPTDFTRLNQAVSPTSSWQADSIPTTGNDGVVYQYLTSPSTAFRPNGDSLARYNVGNRNGISKFIPIGFSFKFDNFRYDSLVISEDGIVSFNRFLNPADTTSQWFENSFYRGSGTYTSPSTGGDCQCDTAWLANPLPFIAAFRDNMQPNSSGNVPSQINYQLSGTAPNRIFRVEWRNMRWHQVCGTQRDNAVSIQLELHETTNKVIFRYKPEANLKLDNCGGDLMGDFSSVNGYNYSAGLFGRRLGLANYLAVNPDSTVLFTNTKVKVNNQNFPSALGYAAGKHYQFTPPTTSFSTCADSLSIKSVTSTCSSGSDGTITITAVGGLRNSNRYFYSKDGGFNYHFGTLAADGTTYQDTFRNLAPGTYRIGVKDLQGSFVVQTVVVRNAKVDSLIVQPITCNGGNNGQIRFSWNKSSPTGTYDVHFEKADGTGVQNFAGMTDTTYLFSGLNKGTYSIKVTFNDFGCTTTATETLVEPSPLSITMTSKVDVSCNGGANGAITVKVSGGTGALQFSKDNGTTYTAGTSPFTFSGLMANTYQIKVKDANNCETTASSVIVGQPTTISVSTTKVDVSCNNGANGSITVTASGGTGALQFSKDNGTTYMAGTSPFTFSGLMANTYQIKVKDANNCETTASSVIIGQPTAINFTTSKADETCTLTNGRATVSASGGTGSINIVCDICPSAAVSGVFSGLSAKTYIFTATDANNCTKTTSIIINNVMGTPSSPFPIENQTVCKNTSVTLTPTGGTTYKFYSSDPTGGGVTPLSTGVSYTFVATMNTTIWITNRVGSCESAPISTFISTDDIIKPIARCQTATIQLNAMGKATLTIAQIDNNSTDNCGISVRSLSKTAFDCSNLGSNTVIFTVTDAAGNSATCSATVTVEDKVTPSVFCKPATLQLDAIGKATLTIAQIDNNSTDNCGILARSLSKTAFDCSNLGSNTIIFTATDASGNSATCSTTVTVEDKIAPKITCPDNILVKLSSGECKRVLNFAATATDNCTASPTITQLAGIQSGQAFGIGTFNTGFKATDASGNTSSCVLSVTVNENTPTGTMLCIGQVNVTLNENCSTKILPEFLLLGNYYGCFDNYRVRLQTLGGIVLNSDTLTSLYIGTTLRAIVTDNTGNSCASDVKIFDLTAPKIQAPPTLAVTCDNVSMNGSPDTSISGKPIVLKECSASTSMSYNDKFFDITCGELVTAPPTGFPNDLYFDLVLARTSKRIIVRTFYVSDIFNNTSSTRQVIYIQTRQIFEVTTPSSLEFSCGNRRVEPTDTIINGVTILGTGFPSLSGRYSLYNGFCPLKADYTDMRTENPQNNSFTIKRTWLLVNTCTNEAKSWVQNITVHDAPPTLTLLQTPVLQIPTGGLLTVTAQDLIDRLTDACTPNNRMIYGLRFVGGPGSGFPSRTSYTFDCNQKGTYNIEVWVKDEGGYIVMNTTFFTIRDDMNHCPTIKGLILREDRVEVPANILLSNAANDSLNSTTGSSYFFKELLANTRYRVMPTRPNTDWLNGVTMFDVALMSRHLLGITPLPTAYRLIGADANRNGEVDAADMLLIQRLILHITPVFPNNNSWRFVVKSYTFNDPTNPFAFDFPETLIIPSLTTSIENGDFVAIKTGDVNLSAGSVVIRGGLKPFNLMVEDIVLEKNKTYEIPIKISPYQGDFNGGNLSALQFSLNIAKSAAQMGNTTKGDLPNCTENNVAVFKNEGIISAGWYRNPSQKFIETDTFILFNLTIKPLENTRLSQVLSINPTFTEGVAFDESGNGATVKLSFGNTLKPSEKPTLLPSRPNPFSDETTISFLLPETGFAKVMVCDLLGKTLMTTEKEFTKGLNEVVFSSKNTPSVSSGILIVRLQTANDLLEQKIVLSR